MSTGLGKMQAAILAALEPARRAHFEGKLHYRGGASMANFHGEQAEKYSGKPREQMIRFNGQDRDLPADAYDLRATLAYLSRTTPGAGRACNGPLQDWDVDRRFAVSFSRAVRTLIARGELTRLLPDSARVREIRFVSRPS
jgi:hypothetical protein